MNTSNAAALASPTAMNPAVSPPLNPPLSVVPPAPARRSTAGLVLRRGLPLLLALAAIGYAAHWWQAGRFHETTDDAFVGADVTVIGAKVAGYITELPVVDNQLVHAGDLLARIDVRDYDAQVERAAGARQAQDAALANLQANGALQQALIERARAGIDAASAEEQRARDDFQRHQDLVSRSSVSVESAQRAEAAYKAAAANTQRARAELLAAQRQLDVIATQRQQVQAGLAQAKAEQRVAQLALGYTEIRAPRDGYVGNRKARVGSYVGAGTALLSLVPAKGLWIDANFKEDQLARMHEGQPVSVRADAWPGEVLHGRLGSLAPATGAQFSVLPAENATGNFTKIVQRVPVRIALDGADSSLGRLRPGLSVLVDVDTTAAPKAATVASAP